MYAAFLPFKIRTESLHNILAKGEVRPEPVIPKIQVDFQVAAEQDVQISITYYLLVLHRYIVLRNLQHTYKVAWRGS